MIGARFAGVDEVAADAELRGIELTGAERLRRDRLHFAADRDAYAAAHLLVRSCAAGLLGVPAARVRLEQHCPRCGGAGHGRPSVIGEPGLFVSLSHTHGHVAAVAATVPCGIDVQTLATDVPRRALTARERAWLGTQADPLVAFTRLWVRKEALIKAGVAADPGDLDVLAASGPARLVGRFSLSDWSAPTSGDVPPVAVGCVAAGTDPLPLPDPIGHGSGRTGLLNRPPPAVSVRPVRKFRPA